MRNRDSDDNDRQMQDLFTALAPQVADHGFTQRTLRRISRLIWMRRLASAAALIIALPLLLTVVGEVLLPAEVTRSLASGSALVSGWDVVVAVGICLLAWRAVEAVDA